MDKFSRPLEESKVEVVRNGCGVNAEVEEEVPLSAVSVDVDASDPLSVYIHLPFTPALHLSCHELAVVTHTESDLTNYTRSLSAEIQLIASCFKHVIYYIYI